MKKIERRKFLLFATKASTGIFIGTILSNCNYIKEMKTLRLKNDIIELLDGGNTITLKWDCGGDESIVYIFLNGNPVDYRDNNKTIEKIYIHIVNLLNLPDVGEFSMEGEGALIKESDEVYLVYESFMKAYTDYGERGEKEEWVETNKREDMYSGRKELFKM